MSISQDELAPPSPPGGEAVPSERPVTASPEPASPAPRVPVRLAVAVTLPTLAAAIMVGGVFSGAGGRIYAVLAGIAGVGVGVMASRMRKPLAVNVVIVVGVVIVGLLMAAASGLEALANLRGLIVDSANSRQLLRPPVGLNPGWQAIIGWLMGTVGFVAAWVSIAIGRPSLGLLVPLPIAAIAGISVPDNAQVPSGVVVLVLFVAGLGLLSGGDGEAEKRPLGFELRRGLRSVPLVAAISAALVGLAQADFLFPHPFIDPTLEPQKPKTVPLSTVEDRVLFDVDSSISGPWRIGVLDVYDGNDWLLPPFAESELAPVPRSGVVDPVLSPGVRATITISGLAGTVLPGLPNTVGIVAKGDYAYDARSGAIRLVQGQVQAGLRYTVVAAALPSVDELQTIRKGLPGDLRESLEMPEAVAAVKTLLARAPKTSKWDQFDFLRNQVLDTVTAVGAGVPRSITAERVQDLLAGSKEGSPFEIVATQAMLARWAGIPSRIGYGFDGGDVVNGRLQVRPKHGAAWVEVYFPDFKWLPVIGPPRRAKATVGSSNQQQFNPNVIPSDEIAVQLFLPIYVPPESVVFEEIRTGVLIAIPIALVLLLIYVTFPALRKAIVRTRRRTAARAAGPRARIELAYTEWRDLLTDYGYRYAADTPLMLLHRFADDEEHAQFAWLITRALWGDLAGDLTLDLASAAEELSRALRRRLTQAHPATVRLIAAVSRLSLRYPYHPDIDSLRGKEVRRVA